MKQSHFTNISKFLLLTMVILFLSACGSSDSNPKKNDPDPTNPELSASTCSQETKDTTAQSSNTKQDWPANFFISATKAYELTKNEGLDLKSYSYGNRIFKDFAPAEVTTWKEVLKRSAEEDDFIIVITYGTWGKVMGDRKKMVSQMQKPKLIYNYLCQLKENLLKLGKAKGLVVLDFEPDPMATFMSTIMHHYDSDPKKIPAKLKESNFPEALESGAPQNFAGFWQVIEFMRDKYAPNVKLAPTIKTWGIPTNPGAPPAGGWQVSSEGVKKSVDYLKNYGVKWDALGFNYNPGKAHDDEQFKKMAGYYAKVAEGLGVRPYFWKTKIVDSYYNGTPESQWEYDDLSFQMRHIQFLADLGYVGMNIGYGSQLITGAGRYVDDKLILPPLLKCWLKQYFDGAGSCTPNATIGQVPITN